MLQKPIQIKMQVVNSTIDKKIMKRDELLDTSHDIGNIWRHNWAS